MKTITLTSTIVVPAFADGRLHVMRVDGPDVLASLLDKVATNLHGHLATVDVLRSLCADLPEARRGFWDGTGRALAVRPRGGVRGASAAGDTAVTVEDPEAAIFWWEQE